MPADNTHPGKSLLIVEDDRNLNESLQRKFRRLGYAVEAAFDGAEALRRMETTNYTGIVLDLMMPIKDGFAVLARKGQTRCAATPVFVLTTLDGEKCDLARELGADRVFLKSELSAAEVVAAVDGELARAR